jgi:hypothetical protein
MRFLDFAWMLLCRMLGEVFRCTDTVVAMLFNRREIVSLPKLSKAVQVTNP